MIVRLLAGVWHRLAGPLQWRLLWLTQPKFLVGVAGVLLDDQARVLLLRHRFWPSGSWGLPGGYVKSGERLEGALERELREETGATIADIRLLHLVSGYRYRVEAIFTARLSSPPQRLDEREVLEARLFPADALPDGLLPSHQPHIVEAVAQFERSSISQA